MADYNSTYTGAQIDAAIAKVGGIEAGADVTDTANVTAAGALMDSEVTNLAAVKALDQGVASTDSPTFAAITVTGSVDGRDVSADGTKLDTIETNADVTDTANVTAAGALMDSEVTNLAAVKAFDPTDYATAAQGALADSAIQATDTASDTAAGVVELATAAETTTGTDTGRAVTPDGLAGSVFGTQVVQLMVFDDSQDVATGDGAGDLFFRVPSTMNGMNLVAVAACVQTAGTTGTTDIQIHNVTDTADMLSTVITIDSGETDSSTAATAAVIDGTADDVATGDILRIDVDAISTTAPKGLLVELQFRLP